MDNYENKRSRKSNDSDQHNLTDQNSNIRRSRGEPHTVESGCFEICNFATNNTTAYNRVNRRNARASYVSSAALSSATINARSTPPVHHPTFQPYQSAQVTSIDISSYTQSQIGIHHQNMRSGYSNVVQPTFYQSTATTSITTHQSTALAVNFGSQPGQNIFFQPNHYIYSESSIANFTSTTNVFYPQTTMGNQQMLLWNSTVQQFFQHRSTVNSTLQILDTPLWLQPSGRDFYTGAPIYRVGLLLVSVQSPRSSVLGDSNILNSVNTYPTITEIPLSSSNEVNIQDSQLNSHSVVPDRQSPNMSSSVVSDTSAKPCFDDNEADLEYGGAEIVKGVQEREKSVNSDPRFEIFIKQEDEFNNNSNMILDSNKENIDDMNLDNFYDQRVPRSTVVEKKNVLADSAKGSKSIPSDSCNNDKLVLNENARTQGVVTHESQTLPPSLNFKKIKIDYVDSLGSCSSTDTPFSECASSSKSLEHHVFDKNNNFMNWDSNLYTSRSMGNSETPCKQRTMESVPYADNFTKKQRLPYWIEMIKRSLNNSEPFDDEIDQAVEDSIEKYDNTTEDKMVQAQPKTCEKQCQTEDIELGKKRSCSRCLFPDENDSPNNKRCKSSKAFNEGLKAQEVPCEKTYFDLDYGRIITTPSHFKMYDQADDNSQEENLSLLNFSLSDTDFKSLENKRSNPVAIQEEDLDVKECEIVDNQNAIDVDHQVPNPNLEDEEVNLSLYSTPKKPVLRVGLSRSARLKSLHSRLN